MAQRKAEGRQGSPILETELSQFVRSCRKNDLKLSQDEFLSLLGLADSKKYTKQYQSKVENARVRVPTFEYLTELSRLTKRPVEELERMAGATATEAVEADRRFPLCFGHDLRGAALFLAVQDKSTELHESFRIASFNDGSGSERSPRWFDPDAPVGLRPSEDRTYSATDVIEDLQNGRIQVGAFPGNIVDERADLNKVLLGIASIVNSTGPLNFVINPDSVLGSFLTDHEGSPIRHIIKAEGTLDTNDLGRIINHLLIDGPKAAGKGSPAGPFKIAVEKNTVGEVALGDACAYAALLRPQSQSAKGKSENISAARFGVDSDNADLMRLDFKDLAEKLSEKLDGAELLGVVTWLPHAWIMSNRVDGRGGAKCWSFILNRSVDATGRPQHMSYDIIVHRDALSDQRNSRASEFRRAIDKLVEAVDAKASYLRQRVNAHEVPGEEVHAIARYFGIKDMAQAAQVIGTILFDVRLTVQGHRALEG